MNVLMPGVKFKKTPSSIQFTNQHNGVNEIIVEIFTLSMFLYRFYFLSGKS